MQKSKRKKCKEYVRRIDDTSDIDDNRGSVAGGDNLLAGEKKNDRDVLSGMGRAGGDVCHGRDIFAANALECVYQHHWYNYSADCTDLCYLVRVLYDDAAVDSQQKKSGAGDAGVAVEQ